ncbi:MAG: phycobilisome protein [Waterburya sp.]
MQSDIQAILHKAEEHYLKKTEVMVFQHYAVTLVKRLETYECLRDQEITIFQPIAEELVRAYPEENPQLLEKALKHWLAVMRYCAMAMLLNNPEYLERRILEWLTEMVQAHQMQSVENTIYDLLLSRLQQRLSQEQLALLKPFLEQSQTTLLGEQINLDEQIPSTVGG